MPDISYFLISYLKSAQIIVFSFPAFIKCSLKKYVLLRQFFISVPFKYGCLVVLRQMD